MSLEHAGASGNPSCIDHDCPHCEELAIEILELRAQVRQLCAARDELVRAATSRDFERPPHYL